MLPSAPAMPRAKAPLHVRPPLHVKPPLKAPLVLARVRSARPKVQPKARPQARPKAPSKAPHLLHRGLRPRSGLHVLARRRHRVRSRRLRHRVHNRRRRHRARSRRLRHRVRSRRLRHRVRSRRRRQSRLWARAIPPQGVCRKASLRLRRQLRRQVFAASVMSRRAPTISAALPRAGHTPTSRRLRNSTKPGLASAAKVSSMNRWKRTSTMRP